MYIFGVGPIQPSRLHDVSIVGPGDILGGSSVKEAVRRMFFDPLPDELLAPRTEALERLRQHQLRIAPCRRLRGEHVRTVVGRRSQFALRRRDLLCGTS